MDNSESNHHIIFVENEEEMNNWSAAKHFNTLPELVSRKYNRLSEEQLKQQSFTSSINSEKELKKMKERRETRYKELSEALEDQETVDRVMSHIELQKNLAKKGSRVKVADGENGFADVYKWSYERKKQQIYVPLFIMFLKQTQYTTLFILILSGSKDKRSKKNVHKDSKTNPNTGIVNPECSSTSISKDSSRSFSNITIIPS